MDQVCKAMDCGGTQVSRTIVVDQSGKSDFHTIQAAIDSIKTSNNKWVKIHIKAGTYTEQIQIPYNMPCIFLEGQGKEVTTVTYNDHQKTDISATFSSFPDNVVASGITFKNSFDTAAILSYDGKRIPALAARIYGDKSAFYNCSFIGFQDTLWDVEGRHYYKNCLIEGAVDFIWGSGQSYFVDCVLNVTSSGSITAQGRSSNSDPSGFVFQRGSVVGSGSAILGRAYDRCSRVIFYDTNLGSVVDPQGWNAWHYTKHEDCIYYAEVGCTGVGANTSKRVPWRKKLTISEFRQQFSTSVFIDHEGWLSKIPLN
ncbi:putative pectinesterase 52 [Glycine soja]|uniref:putative pectinesterase 52 n=1 Tax=Glycine max TaxID=3847 RepID=UPI000E21B60F|nr:putative pectinesterase 52 [Glycine max]XP_028184894.1 putative pectinesterase 52 [Glycine soja]|eukprot:XP_014618237.2 putative pectinesterase 52 [Glycine max]